MLQFEIKICQKSASREFSSHWFLLWRPALSTKPHGIVWCICHSFYKEKNGWAGQETNHMIMKQVRHGGLKCATCWLQNIVATKFQGQANSIDRENDEHIWRTGKSHEKTMKERKLCEAVNFAKNISTFHFEDMRNLEWTFHLQLSHVQLYLNCFIFM